MKILNERLYDDPETPEPESEEEPEPVEEDGHPETPPTNT